MAAETLILQAIDYTLELLRVRESRSAKEKATKRAFAAEFREAMILTRAYVADRRDGRTSRDRDKEVELSLAWNKVGLRGQELEPQEDFYVVYFEKSDFWSDPSGWELSNEQNLDITLQRAEEEAQSYLG